MVVVVVVAFVLMLADAIGSRMLLTSFSGQVMAVPIEEAGTSSLILLVASLVLRLAEREVPSPEIGEM